MKTNKLLPVLAASAILSFTTSASAVTVVVGDSTSAWNGFMNVFELPVNGGGFVFPSGWGVPDLAATFDDGAGTLTLSPNTIGDPDPFWYIGGGAPGNPGNKIMEANLYIEKADGSLAGQTVTFEGNIASDSTTAAHEGWIFIKDFAPDFSSFVETRVPIVPGAFSIDLGTINDPTRPVQYGFQFIGENVWVTDTAPFGNIVISTIPEPSAALLGLLGLGFAARRRR